MSRKRVTLVATSARSSDAVERMSNGKNQAWKSGPLRGVVQAGENVAKEFVNPVAIGGGQARLTVSYDLRQHEIVIQRPSESLNVEADDFLTAVAILRPPCGVAAWRTAVLGVGCELRSACSYRFFDFIDGDQPRAAPSTLVVRLIEGIIGVAVQTGCRDIYCNCERKLQSIRDLVLCREPHGRGKHSWHISSQRF
jgi:hypothetical protein